MLSKTIVLAVLGPGIRETPMFSAFLELMIYMREWGTQYSDPTGQTVTHPVRQEVS